MHARLKSGSEKLSRWRDAGVAGTTQRLADQLRTGLGATILHQADMPVEPGVKRAVTISVFSAYATDSTAHAYCTAMTKSEIGIHRMATKFGASGRR
eukprot:2378403-Pleurochrysis_carterae.AAC.2